MRHNTSRRTASGWRDPKQRLQSEFSDTVHHVQDALQVFKERGVLHHTEYDADIPAAVHGAPKTAEVKLYTAQHIPLPKLAAHPGGFLTPLVVAGKQRVFGAPAAHGTV